MKFISLERTFEQSDLDRMARQVASGFARLGVREGDAVGLLMVNEVEVIAINEALALLGAYAVPVAWHNTVEEISHIACDSGLKVMVSHDVLAQRAAAALPASIPLIVVDLPRPTAEAMRYDCAPPALDRSHLDWSSWAHTQDEWQEKLRAPRPGIIYTSGTTGKPKRVMRQAHATAEARQLQSQLLAHVWGARPGMRSLLVAPLYHSAPLAYVRSAIAASRDDGELHLMPRFDAQETLRVIGDAGITSMWMVPTMFVKLLQLPHAVRSTYDVSSLENIIHSGAPCPVDIKLQMIDWFGPVINEFYGSTEVGPVTYASSADYLAHPGSAGKALDGCTVAIIGGNGVPAPAGTIGEIAAANSTYANFTYRNRQAERDELDLDGLVLTGDIGFIDDDGYLFVKDRKKDMVISGGVNLYPAEVEEVLLQLTNVRDGAAFGLPDEIYGEKLVVAVSLMQAEAEAPARITQQLRQRLSPTKVPKEVFVLDEFPRTEAGKVSKHKLRTLVS